mgnify:CR=1 FL=1
MQRNKLVSRRPVSHRLSSYLPVSSVIRNYIFNLTNIPFRYISRFPLFMLLSRITLRRLPQYTFKHGNKCAD